MSEENKELPIEERVEKALKGIEDTLGEMRLTKVQHFFIQQTVNHAKDLILTVTKQEDVSPS